MFPRDTRPAHGAAVLGAGLAAVLAGVALLMQALDVLPIGWDLVLPLLLVAVGAATATAGVAGAFRGHRHGG
jgi:hypothetical protein